MATLGLCIITKTYDEVADLVDSLRDHFDTVYIQVNNDPKTWVEKQGIVRISRFDWTNDFAAARNALLAGVKTDYWMWIDTDDTIDHPENLRAAVEKMEAEGIDRLMATYRYAQNEQDEEIAPHVRERIMRTAHPFYWMGRVHETIMSDHKNKWVQTDLFDVVQHKTQEEFAASIKRNHKILLEEYNKEPRDPRITYYLGLSTFTQQQWGRAVELFVEHIRTSGSIMDQYDSWLKVAECQAKLGVLDKAISACHEALKLLPQHPKAYFALAQFYYELEDFNRCLEWIKTGMQKPDLKTFAIDDPTLRYRTLMLGALSELQLGRVDDAWELINDVLAMSPKYPLALKYSPIFKDAVLEQGAIERAKWLATYAGDKGGNAAKVLEALPEKLSLDIRLRDVRDKLYPPRTWPAKSIVFYCGPSGEPWGPDTLGGGIGGSEEAVIYLSRELMRQGWEVTVYCDRENAYEDGFDYPDLYDDPLDTEKYVSWRPWHTLNPRDKFDVFVAWRMPENADGIKARKLIVDLHDTVEPERVKLAAEYVDLFMVKSQYHRSLYPEVPDAKFAVVGNGILLGQFDGLKQKDDHSVGWYSSYDRGLATLLEIWPLVRKKVPNAKLNIFYGWNSFDAIHRSNPQMMREKWKLIRAIHDLKEMGVTEHGRVSHEELADVMKRTKVLAYTTEFTEIFAITMVKCLAAGMHPISTGVAALTETQGGFGDVIECTDIYTNHKKKSDFADAIIKALESPYDSSGQMQFVKKFDWSIIASCWDNVTKVVQSNHEDSPTKPRESSSRRR